MQFGGNKIGFWVMRATAGICYGASLLLVLMAIATLAAGVWILSVVGLFIALASFLIGLWLRRRVQVVAVSIDGKANVDPEFG